ncbi:MAG: methylated-DNA--[protein]-cysteine S-methyltransferase [Alphaproteobacteria bacterium]|nr:MAG: methylated-DNA--[protein]-cysteine S-methyltransferase [Alphaproteobacteria bacterium]
MAQLSMHSPVGDLTLHEDAGALVALDWGWVPDQTPTPLLLRARDQLDAYFDGTLEVFDLALRPAGTVFQKTVWAELLKIRYGSTATYGTLAARLGSHPRAIGTACARNPLPIIIPCHRITGVDGALTGYSGEGGIATKAALLRLEGALDIQQELFITTS